MEHGAPYMLTDKNLAECSYLLFGDTCIYQRTYAGCWVDAGWKLDAGMDAGWKLIMLTDDA